MNTLITVHILRIYLGEMSSRKGHPVYELVVEQARRSGMAGATVCRGFMGFGAGNVLHTAKILRLSEDLPVVVEIVDTPERIAGFLPLVEDLIEEGSYTVQEARGMFHLKVRVRDIMTTEVITVDATTTVPDLVRLMRTKNLKAVPVLDGKRIVGMITGGDLLSRARLPLRLDLYTLLPDSVRDRIPESMTGTIAREIMSSPVTILGPDVSLTEALRIMKRDDIKRLPVVDSHSRLCGIVSRSDIFDALNRTSTSAGHLHVLPTNLQQTIRDILQEVPTVQSETTVDEVMTRIETTPFRRVVVVDKDDRVLGLVRDTDLLARGCREGGAGVLAMLLAPFGKRNSCDLAEQAGDVMITDMPTIMPDLSLEKAIAVLNDHQIKRLVVVDEQGVLQGMVDRDAIVRALGR